MQATLKTKQEIQALQEQGACTVVSSIHLPTEKLKQAYVRTRQTFVALVTEKKLTTEQARSTIIEISEEARQLLQGYPFLFTNCINLQPTAVDQALIFKIIDNVGASSSSDEDRALKKQNEQLIDDFYSKQDGKEKQVDSGTAWAGRHGAGERATAADKNDQ